jgi:hypothetical protein
MQKVLTIIRDRMYLFQFIAFAIAKLLLGLVEMPKYRKQENYLPFLISSFFFYLLAAILKLIQHHPKMFRDFLQIQIHSFMIWIVTFLNLIFAYSLCDALDWTSGEKIFALLCFTTQTLVFTLLTDFHYISKK